MQPIRISVPEASRVLGISQDELRRLMRQNKLSYGTATITGYKPDGTPKFRYDIWLPKLLAETGLTEWPPKEATKT